MKRAITAGVLALGGSAAPQVDPCTELSELIRSTYVFKPSQLEEEERAQKASAMDRVWDLVTADAATLAPCLRRALEDPGADGWFLVDGSALLVQADPSAESKALKARLWSHADLADMDRRHWIETLIGLALEGFDTGEAGSRWLAEDDPSFCVPEHGLMTVGHFEGGLFLFGSLAEERATPMLAKLVGDPSHPQRQVAALLLALQATPEARQVLQDTTDPALSPARGFIEKALSAPKDVGHDGAPARLDRADLLEALAAFGRGDPKALQDLESVLFKDYEDWVVETYDVPAAERPPEPRSLWDEAALVLQAEDAGLVRQARRQRLQRVSDEAIHDFLAMTRLLYALGAPAEGR